jgi:hypothetical protein
MKWRRCHETEKKNLSTIKEKMQAVRTKKYLSSPQMKANNPAKYFVVTIN